MIADMSAIAGTASSLKTAGEIVQAMMGLRDASAFQTKAIELQRQILAAQQCALAAHSDQFSLLQRIGELEKEVARAKSWDTEKVKYELKEIHPGSFAYEARADTRGLEPAHRICASCYQKGQKAILQQADYLNLRCPDCKTQIQFKEHGPWVY